MSKTYTKKQIQEAINFWKSKLDDEDFKIENLDESKKDDEEEVEEVLPKELQNILNRTISAEWFAGNIYALFLTAIKKEDEVIGYETTVKIVKNKLAPPFRVANFDMMFGTGISHIGEVLDLSIEEGLLEQSGAWISYNGENIAQGRPKAKVFLEQNPEICDELEEKLRAKWKEEKMNAATPASAINNTDSWKANGDIKEMYNDVKEEVEDEETSKSEYYVC